MPISRHSKPINHFTLHHDPTCQELVSTDLNAITDFVYQYPNSKSPPQWTNLIHLDFVYGSIQEMGRHEEDNDLESLK